MIHTMFIGFGPASAAALPFLFRQGQPSESIAVYACSPSSAASANSLGVSATLIESFPHPLALVSRHVTKIIVELRDDGQLEALVAQCRHHSPDAVIVAVPNSTEGLNAALAAGATRAYCITSLAAKLLASTLDEA